MYELFHAPVVNTPMNTEEWLKVSRRHVDGPADFAVLKAWMMRYYEDSSAGEAKEAVNMRADMMEYELDTCPPLFLPDVSDDLKMLLVSRLCADLGMSVTNDGADLVIRGWIK